MRSGFYGHADQLEHAEDLTKRVAATRAYTVPGSMINMTASLISQTFDLRGPVYAIDAACASSLMAVVRAVEHLRALPAGGGSPVALAGGVYLNFVPDPLVGFCRVGAMAHRECRPFDALAEGFILGEGAGVVVLKRLEDAVRDGDRVYAVIRGVAANCDGRSDSPLSPRLEGQVALLNAGLADAGVDPHSVGYVECHGTATPSGDLVELSALHQALGGSEKKQRIGSIKANIGHTMSAAGVAGLIKAVLAVYHSTLPPQAGFEGWHSNLSELSQHFHIEATPQPWNDEIRRAIVSSFGFGGTNSLALIESAPAAPLLRTAAGGVSEAASEPSPPRPQLLCFSAPTPELLASYWQSWREAAQGQPMGRLAYTQTLTRKRHKHGFAVVATSLEDLDAMPPSFALDKPLSLQLVGGSEEDRAWLAARGVPIADEGLTVSLDQPHARLLALGTARLLGHPVQVEDLFEAGPVADLPTVPLVRQRYWAIAPYQPDANMARLFQQVSQLLGCDPESLRPELQLVRDLALTAAQQLELMLALAKEFGLEALPEDELWDSDPNLGQLCSTLTKPQVRPPLAAEQTISYDTHPFVIEHCPSGRTVLPVAYALDLLAQLQGGRAPFALEKLEVRRGLIVRDQTRIRLVREEDSLKVVEVRGSRDVVAFSARNGNIDKGPARIPHTGERRTSLSLDRFYREVAFHGPLLQGIVDIYQIGENLVGGSVKTSRPDQWVVDDPRSQWSLDPLVIDSAFQMALYWAHVSFGKSALPHEIERVVWLRRPTPGLVQVEWHVEPSNESEILGTAFFYQGDRCLGWVEGVRARLQTLRPKIIDVQSVESLPGYVELQRRKNAAKERGIPIPYFQSHDEVRGAHSQIEGRDLVNFSSYNYLGLSGHPKVTAAAVAATERFGTSVSASRLVAGERPLHRTLETRLASFLGTEDALVMVSGYLTNVTLISHLMDTGDLILYDSLSHDSILKGVRASAAARQAFLHNDMDVLEERLSRIRHSFRRVLVVVEGVYSMDGDYPNLARLVELRDRYKFWLMVDEAHSLGTMGATGRGIGELYDVDRKDVDLWSGTLSKALASCGGYVAGRRELIEYLKYTTPGFVYSVGMPPGSTAAAIAALEIVVQEPQRVRELQFKSAFFLEQIRKHGLDPGMCQATPVIPVILGDSAAAWELARQLALRGINTCPIVYPAVEEKSARLRFFITSLHTTEQLEFAARATAECMADLTVTAGAKI